MQTRREKEIERVGGKSEFPVFVAIKRCRTRVSKAKESCFVHLVFG